MTILEEIEYYNGVIDGTYSSRIDKNLSYSLYNEGLKYGYSYKGDSEKLRRKMEKKIKNIEKSSGKKSEGFYVEHVEGGFIPRHSDYEIDAEKCSSEDEAFKLIKESFNN